MLRVCIETKSEYDHISSIHIFSLGPHPLRELQLLSDCTRELQTLTAAEDPLIHNPTYGTILNPLCKRRPARRPPPAAAPAPFVPQLKASAPPGKEASKPVKAEPKAGAAANDFFGKSGKENPPKANGGGSSKESTPAPEKPGLKRENSSLFKAFAKGKPKEKKKEEVEDVSMRNMSDDEEETYIPPVQEKKESEGDRKSRKEREKALREMMEQDDDEDEAVPSPVPEPEEEETVLEKVKEEEEPEPVVTVSGGRRRGKRRVMKKKTIQDSEGYLGMFLIHFFPSFSLPCTGQS
jgi:DNA polymerase delta subunit 3